MLVELRLKDLAVAADVRLRLGPGLNSLTGTTGAGKSLVVQALRWIHGSEVDRDALREGATMAVAEAVFDLSDRDDLIGRLEEVGVEVGDDGMLVLRREVRREGRARAYLNGALGSAALLRAAGETLTEMQSQHEQLRLRQPVQHVHVLDELGVDSAVRDAWRDAYEEWTTTRREIEAWEGRRRQLREQRDLLEYQRRELAEADLEGDELESLRARVARQEGGSQLVEHAAAARERLEAEDVGAMAALAGASAHLRHVPDELDDLVEARDRLEAAAALLDDVQRALERFVDQTEVDPRQLAIDQERLALLQGLTRKYGLDEADLVALHERLDAQLQDLDDDGMPAALRERRDAAERRLTEVARDLERQRRRVARRVERDAPALLESLGMPGATLAFEFVVEEDADGPVRVDGRRVRLAADGPSVVRMVARTNRGERPGPVDRIASGGELSRIGLALRSMSSGRRGTALLVLDEVDAGLGADLGPALAHRLRALGDRGQVLVITHLPAVAAAAETQLVASKGQSGRRTASHIEVVDGDARVAELQRMIGHEDAESLSLARSLLETRGAPAARRRKGRAS